MKEIWKDIEGYVGYYQVSNLGRVKSLKRININSRTVHSRILKPSIGWGYFHVVLSKDNVKESKRVHRLVGFAFIANPLNYDQINHKDGNKQNNHSENLEWCNSKQNINHALETGLRIRSHSKLSWLDAQNIRALHANKKGSYNQLARQFNVSKATIRNVVKKRTFRQTNPS